MPPTPKPLPLPLCQLPVQLPTVVVTGRVAVEWNSEWTPKPPSSCASRYRTGIDALALRHPWNGAAQWPSRRTRIRSPLSCTAPSERLSNQFQRHAMRHGIFELPNAVINGAFRSWSICAHLACWGRQSALFSRLVQICAGTGTGCLSSP